MKLFDMIYVSTLKKDELNPCKSSFHSSVNEVVVLTDILLAIQKGCSIIMELLLWIKNDTKNFFLRMDS